MACYKAQRRISVPKGYYADLYWNVKGKKSVRLRIYSDSEGNPLKAYDQANLVLFSIRLQIKEKKFDPKNFVAKDKKALKFKNYSEKWLSNYQLKCEKDKIAPTTVNNAKATIEAYLIPTFGEMDIRDINEGDLEDFCLKLPNSLKQSSQKAIFYYMRRILKDAKRRKDIKELPDYSPGIKVKKNSLHPWLDEKTQDIVLQKIAPEHRPIFSFLLRTGCRPSEARPMGRYPVGQKTSLYLQGLL